MSRLAHGLTVARDGRWNRLVVICSPNSWDDVRFAERHLAEQLCQITPVLFVDPPMSRLTPVRQPHLAPSVKGPRLQILGPSLARLTPVVLPGPARAGMLATTTLLVRRALTKAVRTLGGSVEAVIIASPSSAIFGFCCETQKVFWAADDFVANAGAMGQSAARLRRAEAARAAEADQLVVSNPNVGDSWRRRGYNPELIPFGCDADLFATTDDAPRPADIRLPSPIVGFVGHLADRIDIGMLTAVAERQRSLLLVGPRHRFFDMSRLDDLLRRPNVQWVGPKPFEQLPSYQQVIDVGIVPYTNSAFNQGSFPLKTLEYLAAGRPVVSSDLPASRWLDSSSVLVASGPSFADAVDQALSWRRTPEMVEERRRFAREHSWARRAVDFAVLLGLAPNAPVEKAQLNNLTGS